MDSKVELIDMASYDEVYAQSNGEDKKMMNANKLKLQFWLNSIMKILALILIATLIVVLLEVSWGLFLNPINGVKPSDEPKFHCGTNWIQYKDEKCFQILKDTFQTFDDAAESCAELGDTVTLPVIHSKEEQDFLANYLFKVAHKDENFWIGAKVVPNSTFRWIDGSDFTFTNWVTKGPKAKNNYCVQIQAEEDLFGKWIDEPCKEKNLVVCQKMQSWSVDRMQKILISVRKNYGDLLDNANKRIEKMEKTLVPIGFVYVQLPNETSPEEIWPWMNWTDVSSTYEGVFFRVNGGEAAKFGEIQEENAPRLTEVTTGDMDSVRNGINSRNLNVSIPKIGLSQGIYTGTDIGGGSATFWNLKHSDGEIRPRNMAIRIWKRID